MINLETIEVNGLLAEFAYLEFPRSQRPCWECI
jgi:hypothetical protein